MTRVYGHNLVPNNKETDKLAKAGAHKSINLTQSEPVMSLSRQTTKGQQAQSGAGARDQETRGSASNGLQ